MNFINRLFKATTSNSQVAPLLQHPAINEDYYTLDEKKRRNSKEEEEIKQDHKITIRSLPEAPSSDEKNITKLTRIKEKLENPSFSCQRLYPSYSKIILDSSLLFVIGGLAYAIKALDALIITDQDAADQAYYDYSHEIKLNNQTCNELLSPYADLWHLCRGLDNGAPTEYLVACHDLLYSICAEDAGPWFAMLVCAIIAWILLGWGLSNRYKTYNNPHLSLLSGNDRNLLQQHQIQVDEYRPQNRLIASIQEKIDALVLRNSIITSTQLSDALVDKIILEYLKDAAEEASGSRLSI